MADKLLEVVKCPVGCSVDLEMIEKFVKCPGGCSIDLEKISKMYEKMKPAQLTKLIMKKMKPPLPCISCLTPKSADFKRGQELFQAQLAAPNRINWLMLGGIAVVSICFIFLVIVVIYWLFFSKKITSFNKNFDEDD